MRRKNLDSPTGGSCTAAWLNVASPIVSQTSEGGTHTLDLEHKTKSPVSKQEMLFAACSASFICYRNQEKNIYNQVEHCPASGNTASRCKHSWCDIAHFLLILSLSPSRSFCANRRTMERERERDRGRHTYNRNTRNAYSLLYYMYVRIVIHIIKYISCVQYAHHFIHVYVRARPVKMFSANCMGRMVKLNSKSVRTLS